MGSLGQNFQKKLSEFTRVTWSFISPSPFAFKLYHNLGKSPLEINVKILKCFGTKKT